MVTIKITYGDKKSILRNKKLKFTVSEIPLFHKLQIVKHEGS